MKFSFIALVFSVFFSAVHAQPLLIENFDYPLGSGIYAYGWRIHSSPNYNDSITVTDGLLFDDYPGSGIGGAALLDDRYADMSKQFTSQTSGTIYASFLLNASDKNSKGYFFHFGPSTASSHYVRVWINTTGTGVGIGADEPTFYSILPNTTYLMVVKYDFSSQESRLYVFDSMPSSEPVTPQSTFTETASITSIGAVAMRQYSATQNVIVDGIRVATSWEQLFQDTLTTLVKHSQSNDSKIYVKDRSIIFPDEYSNEVAKIYNLLGCSVQVGTVKQGSMDVSKLQKGVYLLKVGERVQKIQIK